jgi:hypothetical protein
MTTHETYTPTGRRVPGWIGVDLDGTLAEYHGWIADGSVGPPIPRMVDRVKAWLQQGIEVRIVTARVAGDTGMSEQRRIVNRWCRDHLGQPLRITHQKDMAMIELWDDRAVSVEANTGRAFRCGAEVQDGPA